MIQRIQTVWFFLASLALFLLLLIPIVTTHGNQTDYWILATGLYQKTNQIVNKVESFLPLLICTIATAVIALVNIFNYSNRTLQKRIGLINIVFIVALSFWILEAAQKIPGGMEKTTYNLGAFLPVLAIIFIGLGLRGINHDEKLIRSADRLR